MFLLFFFFSSSSTPYFKAWAVLCSIIRDYRFLHILFDLAISFLPIGLHRRIFFLSSADSIFFTYHRYLLRSSCILWFTKKNAKTLKCDSMEYFLRGQTFCNILLFLKISSLQSVNFFPVFSVGPLRINKHYNHETSDQGFYLNNKIDL